MKSKLSKMRDYNGSHRDAILTPFARRFRDDIMEQVEEVVNKNVRNVCINQRIHAQLEKIYPKPRFKL